MIAFDIETIPNNALIGSLPEPEVALGNLKDPEKIKEKIAQEKQKQVERMGLSPLYGRICSFSFFGENEKTFQTIKVSNDAEEIELINAIFAKLSTSSDIITWNGMKFDFPFVYKRAAILRVPLPTGLHGLSRYTRKYTSAGHCDLMQELSGWSQEKAMNLDEAGKMFLGRGKTKRDYSTYADLIESGQGELIGLDNLCDTELTYDLYNLLAPYLF
jgi:DNA polymerase elongation subunit (family B)